MTVIERLGGFCHGCKWVVRKRAKSRINTVTEALLSLINRICDIPKAGTLMVCRRIIAKDYFIPVIRIKETI